MIEFKTFTLSFSLSHSFSFISLHLDLSFDMHLDPFLVLLYMSFFGHSSSSFSSMGPLLSFWYYYHCSLLSFHGCLDVSVFSACSCSFYVACHPIHHG